MDSYSDLMDSYRDLMDSYSDLMDSSSDLMNFYSDFIEYPLVIKHGKGKCLKQMPTKSACVNQDLCGYYNFYCLR